MNTEMYATRGSVLKSGNCVLRSCFFVVILLLASVRMQGQALIETVDGKLFFGDITFRNDEKISFEQNNRIIQKKLSDIRVIETEEGGVEYLQEDKLAKVDPNVKGLACAKGNCVYIPYSSPRIVVRWGSRTLCERLMEDGFWKIVGCEEEAHCIFEYVFDDDGRDKAYLLVKDRKGNVLWKSGKVGASDWVPRDAGKESGAALYKKQIKKLKRLVEQQQ